MRFILPLLACSMLMACGLPQRPSLTAEGAQGRSDAKGDEDHDDDERVPDDPVTVARAAKVRIEQGEGIGCPSEALGPVDVHKKMESTEQALERLKLRAAALGADAVVHVEFEHGEGGSEVTHLSGMAVRCNDLIKGRAYDAIGSVQSDGKMGSEERAFASMLEKAKAMHADLVIHVKFEHGEGGDKEGTKVSGTAIKFRSGG